MLIKKYMALLSLVVCLASWSVPGQAAPSFDVRSIEAIMEGPSAPASVDEFLDRLPPGAWTRFVLVYGQRSLQFSTPLLPRIILFNEDASLLLAFSGIATADRLALFPARERTRKLLADTVEMLHFAPRGVRSARPAWRFRQIDFTQAPAYVRNPTSCDKCHHGRPNWDAYPSWRDVYGSDDGLMRVGSIESNNFQDFLRLNRHKYRYRRLLGQPNGDLLVRTERHGVDVFQLQTRGLKEVKQGIRSPLSVLTELLARHNNTRIATELALDEQKDAYKYAVLAALFGCFEKHKGDDDAARSARDILSFLPEGIRPAHGMALSDLKRHIKDTRHVVSAGVGKRREAIRVINGATSDYYFAEERADDLAALSYFIEHRSQDPISMAFWSMTVPEDPLVEWPPLDFTMPSKFADHIAGEYFKRIGFADLDQEFSLVEDDYGVAAGQFRPGKRILKARNGLEPACRLLKEKSNPDWEADIMP